jgi:hypothetical protein
MSLGTILSLVLGAACVALAAVLPINDPDLYWHLASAAWIVEHGQLLRADVFSHTAAGNAYDPGEWLGQLAWYGAYQLGGWQGIVTLRAITVGIATFCAARAVLLVQPRPVAAILPLLAGIAIAKTTWSDRPQLFTLALASLFFLVLLEAHLRGRTRWLLALPPLALLWSSLHGGYALGIVFMALFTAAAVLDRRPHARALVVLTLAAGVLTFFNPTALGPAGLVAHSAAPTRAIQEARPPDILTTGQGLLFALLVMAALGSSLVVGRMAWLWAVLLPPLIWLGLSGQRHLPITALGLVPFTAMAVPAALERLWPRVRLAQSRALAVRAPIAFALAATLMLSSAGSTRAAPHAPDDSHYPAGALAALRATPGNLLNEYDWGGYLIWHAPERPVFIDGRFFLYMPNIYGDYREAVYLGPRFRDVLTDRDIGAVLLRPDRPLAVFLRESGWSVRAEERDRFVLLARP